jgi:glycosyltransferase A (GT-A) superfamily protein (DUF2064 family)
LIQFPPTGCAQEKTVAEYDAQLIENACDLVGTTAALLGPSFSGNYFTTFAKFLHKFYVCFDW